MDSKLVVLLGAVGIGAIVLLTTLKQKPKVGEIGKFEVSWNGTTKKEGVT